MGGQYTHKYKLPKEIKPIPVQNRKTVNLIVGEIYYVSEIGNTAYQCELLDILRDDNLILIACGRLLKLISPFEIGATPRQAILHQITYN